MPSKAHRVSNGQRAAVCGLMIAGVNFTTACQIVGAARPRVKAVLPVGWEKLKRARYKKWADTDLIDLRAEYEACNAPLKVIAPRWGINQTYLSRLARAQKWRMRGRGFWGFDHVSAPSISTGTGAQR